MSQLRPDGGPMHALRVLATKPDQEWSEAAVWNVLHSGYWTDPLARLTKAGYATRSGGRIYGTWQITAAGRDYLASVDGK